MHANAHHFGRVQTIRVAFGIQRVEAVTQVDKKIFGLREALRRREAHVVGIERVGNDEARHGDAVGAGDVHPQGQVVAVVVAVVGKLAIIGHQPPGVGAVAAGVPAQRTLPGQRFDRLQPQAHVLALGGFVDVLVADPAPAVAGDLMAQFDKGGTHVRVALQGHADTENRQWQLAFFEFAQNAPHARACAIFVDAFHAQMPVGEAGWVEHFG